MGEIEELAADIEHAINEARERNEKWDGEFPPRKKNPVTRAGGVEEIMKDMDIRNGRSD